MTFTDTSLSPPPAQPLLLATKLHAPPLRPGRVSRQRLFDRLSEGAALPLTLVSAPAGFGKSTLVGDWLARSATPAAWLSLDAGDGELRRFLRYFLGALEVALPGVGRELKTLLASPELPDSLEILLTPLLNDLFRRDACTLVLDDYHLIDAPAVHAAVAFLIERLPPSLRLVMATRADPELPLSRLRARGLLAEIRAEELRFTQEEAAAFLCERMGLPLSPGQAAALERRTEGWIAGLQLAALSLAGRGDSATSSAAWASSPASTCRAPSSPTPARPSPSSRRSSCRRGSRDGRW